MRIARANVRGGRGYNEVMARLLHNHGLGDPKWKQTRAALLNIHEHRADVEDMRSRWDDDQRLKWQAPTTVWDRFSGRKKADDPRPRGKSSSASNRSQVLIDLQEENDRLRRELARLKANPFDGLDAAGIVTLLIAHCDDEEMRAAIVAGLVEGDSHHRSAPAAPVDDGWPVVAPRPDAGGFQDG